MREIKFRGKRVDNGEWVYGDLIQYESGEVSIFSKKLSKYGYEATEMYKRDRIIPETVGQYTGLTDKNGKEIYEGDIVKFEDVSGYKDGCASVIWHEDSCGYYLENDDDNIYDTLYDFTPSYQMEIIGNIHENLELLEGKE